MRIDYTSEQGIEIIGADGVETIFEINLHCTANSTPGRFSPIDGGYPPEGAEFEFVSVSLPVKRVNRREGQSEYEAPITFTYAQFVALVGEDNATDMIDRAEDDAAESGQF